MKVEVISKYEVGDETAEEAKNGTAIKGKVIKVKWRSKDFWYLIEHNDETRKWVSERDLEDAFC